MTHKELYDEIDAILTIETRECIKKNPVQWRLPSPAWRNCFKLRKCYSIIENMILLEEERRLDLSPFEDLLDQIEGYLRPDTVGQLTNLIALCFELADGQIEYFKFRFDPPVHLQVCKELLMS